MQDEVLRDSHSVQNSLLNSKIIVPEFYPEIRPRYVRMEAKIPKNKG